MKTLDLVTFNSGYKHLANEGKATRRGFVSFAEMGVLFTQNKKKPVKTQGWTYIGNNWNKSVRPYFDA